MVSASAITKLRFLWQKRRPNAPRMPAPRNRHLSVSSPASTAHMIDEPIDEELLPGDRLRYFYPMQPGEILDGRFKTIAKLGFGTGSTVWLAQNLKFKRWRKSSGPRYVSIKIPALDANASGETTKSKLITNANPSHEGLSCIRIPIDEFQLQGPQGMHSCLVYEPMRETLFQFQRRMPGQRLAMPLFKPYVYLLLQALDYLHTECRLIHTDIKDDNIMVTIENDAILADFVNSYKNNPQPRHIRTEDGRVTYLVQEDFGPLRRVRGGNGLLPKLADFNLSLPGLPGDRAHLSAVQSHRYRAPEVLLGCPWSYSVDIWNLGLLMWNLLEDISLFDRPAGEDGEYDAHVHLAQMVSVLGDPPEELIKRERMYRKLQLGRIVVNLRGKECKTMNEFWGGPFFDDDNQILRKDLLGGGKKLADTVTELAGDEKEEFLDFASSMLQWLPEKRKTAKELLQHSFFDSLYKERERYYQRRGRRG
ncbi:Serine/threonine-protein kinase SRPK [Tolypocladium paradoxum]|uniref:Serine/threonine-protein kinase SRPK n=1 Tax=Tolypocladium paradoxum TaxID=94208 RepID=A0A2S4L9C5_9HYPO|nr:Serine/threonine-protein kinase SRPK [Tolypocladium paradoxum]